MKTDFKRAGPRVPCGGSEVSDGETDGAVRGYNSDGSAKGRRIAEGSDTPVQRVLEHVVRPTGIMFQVEVVDIAVARFSQHEVHAVDNVPEVKVVFEEAPVEKVKLGGVKAAHIIGGAGAAAGGFEETSLGGSGADGVAGGIPSGVGGEGVEGRIVFDEKGEQGFFG